MYSFHSLLCNSQSALTVDFTQHITKGRALSHLNTNAARKGGLAISNTRRRASRGGHRAKLLSAEYEPACWRGFLGSSGDAETLKPDLYAVKANAEYEDSWFIEVDRGTESLPTVLKKCAQYERHQRSGQEQASRGVLPAVLGGR